MMSRAYQSFISFSHDNHDITTIGLHEHLVENLGIVLIFLYLILLIFSVL